MRKHSFEVSKCWLQVCSKGTEQFRPRGKEKLLSFWAWCWQTPSCCQLGSVSPCSWWGHWIRAPWWHCSSSVQRWMWLVWMEPLLWVQPLNAIDHHHCVCIQVPKSAPAGMFWAISTCLNISPHQMLWFSAFIYLLSLNKLLFFFFWDTLKFESFPCQWTSIPKLELSPQCLSTQCFGTELHRAVSPDPTECIRGWCTIILQPFCRNEFIFWGRNAAEGSL